MSKLPSLTLESTCCFDTKTKYETLTMTRTLVFQSLYQSISIRLSSWSLIMTEPKRPRPVMDAALNTTLRLRRTACRAGKSRCTVSRDSPQ